MVVCNTTSAERLAYKVEKALGIAEHNRFGYTCLTFSDGEKEVHFEQSIRGENVYIISQDTYESIMELFLAIQAAKLGSANKIVVILPCLPLARQDRKSLPRVSVGAKLIAQLLEAAGMDKLITFDLHAAQEQCFFDVPVDHLHASYLFKDYLTDEVLVAPDAGSCKMVSKYSSALHLPMVTCYKSRLCPNEVGELKVLGDVSGKEVVIIDDMCDTAGTLCKCAEALKAQGATKITAMFTHPVLSGPAMSRLDSSCISHVITTDSLPTISRSFITVVSLCDMIAHAIRADIDNTSITNLFNL